MSIEPLTTHEMLMAIEEMPPHTVYRGFLPVFQSAIAVYRCDCLPGGAYVFVCYPLAALDGVPHFWVGRDEFLLDLGYRGVTGEARWTQTEGAACDCDRPAIAESLAAIREGLAS